MPDDLRQKTDLIRGFLDGSLPAAQMAAAEQLFSSDPAAHTLLDEQDKIETFVTRLQEAIAMPAFPSEERNDSAESLRQTVAQQMKEAPATDDTAAAVTDAPMLSTDSEAKPAAAGPLGFLSPPQAPDEIGRLNGYRVIKKLGEGGMGMVFEAEDMKLKRRVALKVMKPEIAARDQHRVRFIREAQTAAAVEHDHICPIYQVGEENGVPFIAMPFLKGEPLDAVLKRQKRLPIDEAVRIGREVAEGLAAAHEAGLVHRDIKPGNVWLETRPNGRGRARILDFGLARGQGEDAQITASGAILGTPAYMAPEQARGKAIDHRADLFSLGVMLYEMTTGRRPFSGNDTMSILTSLAVDDPAAPDLLNPSIPADLARLIMQLLAKSSDKRPANGRVVSEELLGILARTSRPIVEAMPGAQAKGAYAPPLAQPVDMTDVDPWGGIDESTASAAPLSPSPVHEARSPEPKRSSGSRLGVAIAAVLMLLIGGFAAYKLVFETKEGILIVEVDGDADVRFKKGKLEVYGEDGKLKYTLEPSEKNKSLPPGKYLVKVTGVDGLKLETPEFEIGKGGTARVRVIAEQRAVVKKDPPKSEPTPDPDRKAAEWVVSVGGKVALDNLNEFISDASLLPQAPFRLRHVELTGATFSRGDLSRLAGLKNLRVLWLGETADERLMGLRELATLQELSLKSSAVTDACLIELKGLTGLNRLNLLSTRISDDGLAILKMLPALRFLQLQGSAIGDAGLKHIGAITALTNLGIADTKTTDAGLDHLKGMPNLIKLHMQRTNTSRAAIEKLAAALPQCRIEWDGGVIEPKSPSERVRPLIATLLKAGVEVSVDPSKGVFLKSEKDFADKDRLQWIQIKATDKRNPLADPAVLTAISQIPPEIWINNGDLVDVSGPITEDQIKALIDALGKQPVAMFGIHSSPFKDAALTHLARLPNLSHVNLTYTPGITDEGLKHIAAIPKLKWLLLNGGGKSGFTSAGLAHLRGRPLDRLDLRFVEGIDDASIMQLAGTPTLKHLEVLGGKLTADGVKKFAAALPQCKIVWDGGVIEPKSAPAPAVLTAAQRQTLQQVLSDGGGVNLTSNSQYRSLKQGDSLPVGPVVVHDLQFSNLDLYGDANIDKLKDIPPLTGKVRLDGTAVTDRGLDRLTAISGVTTIDGIVLPPKCTDAGLAYLNRTPLLRHVSLSGTTATDAWIDGLKKLPNLNNLHLSMTKVTDNGLKSLRNFPALHSLSLSFTKVTDAGLESLRGLPLQMLALQNCKEITGAGLQYLKETVTLRNLRLEHSGIDDAGLVHIQALSRLTGVNLAHTKVTADGVQKLAAALPRCKIEWDGGVIEPKVSPDRQVAEWALRMGGEVRIWTEGEHYVTVSGVSQLPAKPFRVDLVEFSKGGKDVTDESLGLLTDLRHLVLLTLTATGVTDKGIERLVASPNLATLQIVKLPWGPGVTDASLAALRRLPQLFSVALEANDQFPTDAGLKYLSEIPTLKMLEIYRNSRLVTSDGLSQLAKRTSLQNLILGEVDDSGLNCLSPLKNLECLDFWGARLTDAGLGQLVAFERLENLTIVLGKQISDTGLIRLKDLKRLKNLKLRTKGSKVTADGVQKLAAALPQCRIEWDGGVIEPKSPNQPAALSAEQRKALEQAIALIPMSGRLDLVVNGERIMAKRDYRLPPDPVSVRFVNLDFAGAEDSSKIVDVLGRLHDGAEMLNLASIPLTDEQLGKVAQARMEKLTYLNLDSTRVTDVGCVHLERFSSLERLLLLNLPGVTDKGLDTIAKLRTLRELELKGTKVAEAGIKKLAAALPQCKIDWDGGVIEPTTAANPDRKAAEWVLSVGGTVHVSGENREIKGVVELPEDRFTLMTVNIPQNARITDVGLASLRDCAGIRSLSIAHAQVTDAGLIHFKDYSNLTHLSLIGTKVTEAGLIHFKGCGKLTYLNLQGTTVSKIGLAHFKDCGGLKECYLYGTAVTDNDLAELQRHKKLTALDVRMTKVTVKGLADFHTAVPDCKIVHDGGVIEPKK